MSGYTKMSNDLFQKVLPKLDLTGSEFRVLMFFIGDTLCFNRKYNAKGSAYCRIVDYTNLSERQVKRATASLIKKGILKVKVKSKGKHPQIIEFSVTNLVSLGDKLGQFLVTQMVNLGDTNGPQEIKEEEIQVKEIKEKEKEIFSPPRRTNAIKEMSAEEWAKMNEEDFDDE